MKKLFMTLLVLIYTADAFCQSTYPVNINDMAQIKFPGAPVEKSMPGKLVAYGYQGIQQSYIVIATHLKKPTNGPSASYIRKNFFDNQIQLDIEAVKGTLLYKNEIQVDGVNGVEYSFYFVVQNVKIYNYNRFVFLNEVGIDYFIMSREPLKLKDKVINDYFNSFKIIISKKEINSLK